MIDYDEYLIKKSELSKAYNLLKLGKISPEEFSKKYIGVPTEELPDNFKEIALKECDYNRGPFGLTEDGRLYIQEWTIFPDDPDHVYVVFDTIFRGEYDEDYIVVAFPVHAFNNKDAMKEFVNELEIEYDKKQKAEQRKRLKEIQKSNFQKDFSTQLHDERNLRIEQSDWKRLRKKYLPEEFDWIVEAFIKRGILEKEYKQDYINYLKIDLL